MNEDLNTFGQMSLSDSLNTCNCSNKSVTMKRQRFVFLPANLSVISHLKKETSRPKELQERWKKLIRTCCLCVLAFLLMVRAYLITFYSNGSVLDTTTLLIFL